MSGVFSSFQRNASGSAAAEMALMLPLLLVLLFVTFEGGYFLWNQHVVTKAVRDGARYAGRNDFSYFTACPTVDAGMETKVKELTRTGQLSGGAARLPGWTNSDVTVTCADNSSFATGLYHERTGGAATVTVSASVSYTPLFAYFGIFPATLTLNASAQSAVMGL